MGRFSHDLITPRQKESEHNFVRLVWEFDYLHFAQYISKGPQSIDFKHTWSKKFVRMNRASQLNPLFSEWFMELWIII